MELEKSGTDFMKLDLEKSDNFHPVCEVEAGFCAKRALYESNVSKQTEKVLLEFRVDYQEILKNFAKIVMNPYILV